MLFQNPKIINGQFLIWFSPIAETIDLVSLAFCGQLVGRLILLLGEDKIWIVFGSCLDFKGGNEMPRSEVMDRAIKKYEQDKVDRVIFRVPKGMKEPIQAHAEKQGESLSAFLNRAVQETMKLDNQK